MLRMMIIMTLCFSVFTAGRADAQGRKERHAISSEMPSVKHDCAQCHVINEAKKVVSLKKKLSGLCLDCHPDRMAPLEHKVDVAPTMEVKGLPLSGGKITCVTCHDPHLNIHGKLLRMRDDDLCLVCHPQ
jgi:predicted CXXCH cytochrome family protein